MKKITVISSSAALFLGVMAPAANAAIRPPAGASPTAYTHAHGAVPGAAASCDFFVGYLQNFYGGKSWNATVSPYTLWIQNERTATTYCRSGSAGAYRFNQYGTGNCLEVIPAGSTITEGSCSGTDSEWNVINVKSGKYEGYSLLESDADSACIYQDGLNSPADHGRCNGDTSGDAFQFSNWIM